MNPFDRARLKAQEVRASLVESSGKAYPASAELLAGVETVLELAVDEVPANHFDLGGGDGVLLRSIKTILIRNDVRPDERVYLIAHELGHWYLDSPQAPRPSRIPSSAGAEAAGGAAAIVDGYGAWERQELKANVFARELLLPRSVVHQAWANGWRARQIGTHFGLGKELVRQQMADALLLPEMVPVALTQAPTPSDAQRLAAQASERYVNVVAGPGTGKTTTLVHRVAHLINDGVQASRILVLTFTNKAAQELIERLTVGNVPDASHVWAGTFHAFGLEFLRKHANLFNLSPQIKIADLLQQVRMMAAELPNIQLAHFFRLQNPYDWLPDVLKIIHRLKEELVSPDEYERLLASLPPVEQEVANERQDIVTVYRAYEQVMRRDGWVDYADLLVIPTRKAAEDRASVAEFLDQYDHVLVDEYQDVNYVMVELVKRLGALHKNLWVVGDVRQAIHHWRGASIQSLLRFEHAFASGNQRSIQSYSLDINRRSSPEILALVRRAGTDHVLEQDLPLDNVTASRRSTGVKPMLFQSEDNAGQINTVAQKVSEAVLDGYPYGTQGVISATNGQLEQLAKGLEGAGIPVLHIGDLYQRAEVKPFLCLMQLLTQRSPAALYGLLNDPDLSMPTADIETLMALSKTGVVSQRGRWLGKPIAGLTPRGEAVVTQLRGLLGRMTRSTRPWDFICELLFEKGVGLANVADQSTPAQIQRLALWLFLYGVRNGDGVGSQATLYKFLVREDLRRRINQRSLDRALPPEAAAIDAVTLMTIHGSKGLEFPIVHVANVEKSRFGAEVSGQRENHNEVLLPPEVLNSTSQQRRKEEAIERNNLLYVALSRAKDRLNIYICTENQNIPSLVKDPNLVSVHIGRAVRVAGRAAVPPTSAAATVAFTAFDSFLSCPLKYHYAHELTLPAEQEIDLSMRARSGVLAGLEYAFRDGLSAGDAFWKGWMEKSLPMPDKDQFLVNDGWRAFSAGVSIQQASGASYLPSQNAVVNGLTISLPWMLEEPSGTIHWLRTGMAVMYDVKHVRPMMTNMGGRQRRSLTLHSLTSGRQENCIPSNRINSTNVFKAAEKLRGTDRSPIQGYHCLTCAYASICPQKP